MLRLHKENKSKGITLIALIITIIIMLIIAGVAMSMLSTDGGIFTKTKYARDKYGNSVSDEAEMMDDLMKAFIETESVGYHIIPPTATQEAKLILNATEGYTPQLKRGEDEWTDYSSEIIITKNETIYTRLKDNNTGRFGSPRTINISNIDREAPNDFKLEATETMDSITVKAEEKVTDTASAGAAAGIAGIGRYKYKIDDEEWFETTEESHKFTGLQPGSTHTVSMIAIDKAGNPKEALNNDYIIQTKTKIGDYVEYSVVVDGVTYDKWIVFDIDDDGSIEIITLNGPNKVFGKTVTIARNAKGEYLYNYSGNVSYHTIVNYVKNLNTLSAPFAAGNYGESARHLGTYKENPANRETISDPLAKSTHLGLYVDSSSNSYTYYTKDVERWKAATKEHVTSKEYAFAKRYIDPSNYQRTCCASLHKFGYSSLLFKKQ